MKGDLNKTAVATLTEWITKCDASRKYWRLTYERNSPQLKFQQNLFKQITKFKDEHREDVVEIYVKTFKKYKIENLFNVISTLNKDADPVRYEVEISFKSSALCELSEMKKKDFDYMIVAILEAVSMVFDKYEASPFTRTEPI
jgi:hypothetical protein